MRIKEREEERKREGSKQDRREEREKHEGRGEDGERERGIERPNLKEWKHNSEGAWGRPVPRIRVIDSVMSRTTRAVLINK